MAKVKGLYKRGNIWWLCYQDPFGVMRYESSKSISKKDAEYILACRRKDVREGKTPEVKKIKNHSFKELAESYLIWSKPQRAYQDKARRVKQLVDVFGNYALRSFTTRLIEEYQAKRLEYNKPATSNRMLTIIKHMFRKAADWDMVEEGVLKRIAKVKLTPEHNTRLRFLSKEECQALVNACNTHLKPIVVTALNSGMRKSEILGLKFEQVDFRHQFIFLEITKNGKRREIPMNSTLRATLEAIPHSPESEYVFTDRNGKPFKDVKRSFKTALRKAGIADFRFHDMRSTFCSHLVMAGVDLTSVKELMGHQSLNMVMRYAALSPSHRADAVKVLDKRLWDDSEDTSDLLDFNRI